ncbi:MAG: CDGSH iron-sulfur domain-containing protein [Elusimicrobia bacterium]|nr:CDGSH iron-sulfur domain-containing protein [Elusimicrobiota bacterium]
MSEPKATQKFPYVIEEPAGKKAWCACGESQKQPYCDGSHARLNTGISPIRVELSEGKKVAWCGCRRSKNKPYCDGSHRSLP